MKPPFSTKNFHCKLLLLSTIFCLALTSCGEEKKEEEVNDPPTQGENRMRVIFDTDANNELDDQHALAYLLFNRGHFDIAGVTVNATYNGGDITEQLKEAERVLSLCDASDVPLLAGANGSFGEITQNWDHTEFDGQEAVDFILRESRKPNTTIIAVGKLTNIALALKKDPEFSQRTCVVWLGSNYPEPGEYNQDNDTIAMNYLLNSSIPLEIVTVRYGKDSGTDAVRVSQAEINEKMPGLGPEASTPVVGRHGSSFRHFGDYSVSLFEHIDLHGDPPSRALFDMVAVAVLKSPSWGNKRLIAAPILIDNKWTERPENTRQITIWEDFDKKAILEDFYDSMREPQLLTPAP